MSKFYNFLNEGRTEQISYEKFTELLDNNCSQFVKSGNKIYRGMKSSIVIGFVDPTKFTRESAYAKYNYYTILFDELLLSWKNMPKRSKSIICGSGVDVVSGYGRIYEVYPYNGSKIGVCSEDDLWYSFGKNFPYMLDEFNEILEHISNKMNYPLKETKQSLLNFFDKIDDNIDNIINIVYDKQTKELLSKYQQSKLKFLPYLSNMFDPDRNDIKNYTTSNYKHYNDKEVWIEGKCLLKRYDI